MGDDFVFCNKCGAKASNNVAGSCDSGNHAKTHVVSRNNTSGKWLTMILVVFLVTRCIYYCAPKLNTSWAVDEACDEVKSQVYRDYGEIPKMSGKLIYKKGQHHIVVVKYEIPKWEIEWSRACLVYGYRESNCFVSKMTTENTADYDYKSKLEELKALWSLD